MAPTRLKPSLVFLLSRVAPSFEDLNHFSPMCPVTGMPTGYAASFGQSARRGRSQHLFRESI